MRKKSYIFSILSIIILLFISGCSFPWQKKKAVTNTGGEVATTTNQSLDNQVISSGAIKKFKDTKELQDFLTSHEGSVNNSLIKTGGRELMVSDLAMSPSAKSESTASTDYSKTNVQVDGVDEADIMKTDGEYVYLLDYNDLFIIKAKPAATAAVVTKITFKSRPQEFYISGDKLVVFGNDSQIVNDETYQSFKRQSSYTYLKVFDISDPKNPKQVRDLNLEGSYSNSRVVGDYLYFITENYQNYIAGEPLLPRIFNDGQALSDNCTLSAKCYLPNIFYFDIPYQSYVFTSVTAVNIKNAAESISSDIYLLSGNQSLYASLNNIYITYTEYLNEYDVEQEVTINLIKSRLSSDDQSKITKIELVEDFILSSSEKKNKIYSLVQAYINNLNATEAKELQAEIDVALNKALTEKAKEMEKTVIHKISFSGSKLNYQASGSVPGRILNQFSMDEKDNFFRIATTRSQSWSRIESLNRESYSNVYVLDDKLQTIGVLENLAPGERIYSVRFIGDRAYLVTFKQTDPLFAIDLKDPKAPRVLGELKIPGYSNYLHPYAENILLGFGRDTELKENGNVINKGLKLSLFDVSDPSSPKELDNFITGNEFSDSIALYDHKAFLASGAKKIVSVPAVLRNGQYGGKVEFSGSLVFEIDNNKIKLRGRIDHSDGGNYINKDYWGSFNYYDNSVKRSLYIDNSLYTFSNKFLKINDITPSNSELSLIKTIDLLPNLKKDFEVTPVTPVIPVEVIESVEAVENISEEEPDNQSSQPSSSATTPSSSANIPTTTENQIVTSSPEIKTTTPSNSKPPVNSEEGL
jgi:inhibitor of cysteine peptidase